MKQFIWNILLVFLCYFVCRVEYVVLNYGAFSAELNNLSPTLLLKGSLLFDTSAILYTNALFALLCLLPLHYKETRTFHKITKWIYLIINSLAIALNLGDSVYYAYTGHRTTMSVTGEFANESNLISIFSTELINHWYLVLLWGLMTWGLWKFYSMPKTVRRSGTTRKELTRYYILRVVSLAIFVPLCIAGMRGGFTTAVRPITISNANQYVNHPQEAAIVLNTPFSLFRTIGKNVFSDPGYYSREEMERLFSPIHRPQDTMLKDSLNATSDSLQTYGKGKGKNIVVLIVESFGREYMGHYNEGFLEPGYKGFTPFIDSMLDKSLTFDYTFANGRQSIDGMPSILSSIPRFIEPFFLTPASLNDISGIAGELGKKGYSSAFFHGAENGSMGFEAFSKTTGFQKYYGRTEFNADKRFRGDEDYDGTWAIWDKPFLQFYALKMSEMKEPFVTAVFTASSHHPFAVPSATPETKNAPWYSAELQNDKNPLHKCITYTDDALRQFFLTAQKQPWYKNTIFVLTADHTNMLDHKEYATDLGLYRVPILFFDPSGEMPRGRRHCIAQQIDIMPTLLGYLGYDKPYVGFGTDLLHTPDNQTWAVSNANGIYQFVKGDYVIQFNGSKVIAAYNYKTDWMLTRNLINEPSLRNTFQGMESTLKAMIQNYMQRMTENQLIVR